jgi:hypothetical protein
LSADPTVFSRLLTQSAFLRPLRNVVRRLGDELRLSEKIVIATFDIDIADAIRTRTEPGITRAGKGGLIRGIG